MTLLSRSDLKALSDAKAVRAKLNARRKVEKLARQKAAPAPAKGQRQPRMRDRVRLGWIKLAPCIACLVRGERQTSATEAAHYKGEVKPKGWRWFGSAEKSHDQMSLPLCGEAHHREGPNAEHQMHERHFWPWLGVDPVALICALDDAYSAGREAEPVIRQFAARKQP